MAIARIDPAKKELYNQISAPIKSEIESIKGKIKSLEVEILKNTKESSKYNKFLVVNFYLDIAINYIKMNKVSVNVMQLKQDDLLENARKSIYSAVSTLEQIFGSELENDLNESSEKVQKYSKMTPYRKLYLFHKLENVLKVLGEELGPESKWKYKILEMFSKFAVVVKNSIDFKEFVSINPLHPHYRDYSELVRYSKELLRISADGYREKYEVSGHEISDMRKAQDLLKAVMRIDNITGMYDESREIKKIIEKWNQKLEDDLKVKEGRKK